MTQANTVGMWALLCEELESSRERRSTDAHLAAARRFEQAARDLFPTRPERLRDALEIAGDVFNEEGCAADARRCFQDAASVGDVGPDQAGRLFTKLAMLEESAGEFARARACYEAAIKAMASARDHSGLATLLNNLAGLCRQQGDVTAAAGFYQQALDAAIALHGPDHPEVALMANNLAVARTDEGDLAQAEQLHLRALQIRERNYGAHHPEVAESLGNLGAVYQARNLFGKAERFYQGALEIFSECHGPDSAEARRVRENYASLPQVRARTLARTQRLG